MDAIFKFISNSRQVFIELINSLTIEQLNRVPEGYNNNVIWNFGHIVVSTQALCYVSTGIMTDASSIKFNPYYKSSTRPSYSVSELEVAELKNIAMKSIAKIEEDYNKGMFSSMIPFSTSTYRAEINNIEELLITTIGHDNLHYGYALALKKRI
jgi:hypothetical protein